MNEIYTKYYSSMAIMAYCIYEVTIKHVIALISGLNGAGAFLFDKYFATWFNQTKNKLINV